LVYKMDLYGSIFALVVSLLTTIYTLKKNTDSENKVKIGRTLVIFVTIFAIVYMLYVLFTDTNDTSQMFSNMKTGDPPF
jgi:uncharacterized membrane protein YesL